MDRKVVIVASFAIALLAIVIVALSMILSSGDEGRVKASTDSIRETVKKANVRTPADIIKAGEGGRRRQAGETNGVSRVKRRRPRVPAVDHYTAEERRLADNLQSAADDSDIGEVRKAVAEIASQKNPELKQEAISALGFFGKDALTDLMAFLKDPDQEVVDSAADTISSALDELEDEENVFKAEFVSTLLSVDGLCSEDAINTLAGLLESIGSSDEKLAVQAMVNLIEDEKVGKGVKSRLKEAYEFVTSEEYTSFEAAEKWYRQKIEEEASETADDEDAADDYKNDVEDGVKDGDEENNDNHDNQKGDQI